MMQDLLAGQIDLTFTQVASALAQVRSGQVKAYAVMAKARWAEAPDTPTSDEGGVPGLYASFWHGLWAPKGRQKSLPNSIVRLSKAWPTRPCVNASLSSDRSLGLATNKRRTGLRRNRKLRSRNGGRSSRRRGSGRNNETRERRGEMLMRGSGVGLLRSPASKRRPRAGHLHAYHPHSAPLTCARRRHDSDPARGCRVVHVGIAAEMTAERSFETKEAAHLARPLRSLSHGRP
jgi:hypothetical protein